MLGVSLPSFAVGILLILLFSVTLHWLPAFGRGDVVELGWWQTGFLTPSGRAALILPAITLSLVPDHAVMRLVRAEMLEVLRSRLHQVRPRPRPARPRRPFPPCPAQLPDAGHHRHGPEIGNLIAFALVTETVFQWPGMGLLFVQAVIFIDIPVMAAYLMVVSFIFVALNTLVDLLYAVVDPRLRARARSGRRACAAELAGRLERWPPGGTATSAGASAARPVAMVSAAVFCC